MTRPRLRRVLAAFSSLSLSLVCAQEPARPDVAPATLTRAVAAAPAPSTNVVPAPGPAPAQPPPSPAVTNAPGPSAGGERGVRGSALLERNIRFQFDGIPYMDVVERFSQMAGKPLLSDTNVQGTLTFSDPNPYTYVEALDTLNLVLAMKRVMLVDTGPHLRLVSFREIPSMPIPILRGLDKSGDVRPGEVVTVVLDVKNVDSKEVADAVTSMLSSAGSVAALSRGRGLILTDRMENIQRIRTLLTTIDVGPAPDRQMKTYTLVHASGAILADLLNRTFGVATAPKRTQYNPNSKVLETLPPDPNDYITAVYDDASRTMVLFGPNDRLGLADELIRRFEEKDGPPGDVRIYYPQSVKAEELAGIIRQAVPGVAAPNESGSAAAAKARVIVDASQNRLIVAAPVAGQLDQIDQLVNRVDRGTAGPGGSPGTAMRSLTIQLTRVFRPRVSEAASLAGILGQALVRRLPSGAAVSTATVSHDVASRSVIVSGSPGDVQIAADIVAQLESGAPQPSSIQTRLIDVGSVAEARRLMPLVEQIYRSQAAEGAGGAGAHARILADPDAGRLIVTASEEHLARIESLVEQLRADQPRMSSRRLQAFPLANLRAEAALATLQGLVTDRMLDRRFADLPKPSLLADGGNNRLLVTGTESQIEEIRGIIESLDVAPAKPKREMAVVSVQSKPAAELIALATQLLSQMGEIPSDPLLAPRMIADAAGRQVIVLAAGPDVERIRGLLQRLDAPVPASARQFKSIPLRGRHAGELMPLVQQLYAEQLKGQPEPAGGVAALTIDARENRIMASGPEKEIARVEAIVRQLDPEGGTAGREETRVVRLRTSSAGDLSGLIEKSLNAQQRRVGVLVDARSNALVVTGESGAIEAAVQLIQQLDARPDLAPKELRILELKSAEASVITPMLTSLFAELIKDQRGADYASPTRIVPDTTANRIVVTGVREEIDQVADLVRRLDQAPEQAPGARVFKLASADAVMLGPVVSNAMVRFDSRGQPVRRVTVSVDDKSNSLIVSGTRSDLQDAASVIDRLDGESGGGRSKVLKIVEVQGADVEGLAALVGRVFTAQNPGRNPSEAVTITPEPNGRRLVVMAPASMLAQVVGVIESLDTRPEQSARELQAIELTQRNAAELAPRVSQVLSEQSQGRSQKPPTLYPDASGSRLMVLGTRDQVAGVRQVVATFEGGARQSRTNRTFDLGRLAEAQRILPMVQRLYRDQTTNSPSLGAPDAQMLSDGRTGRVVVSARADQMAMIEELFRRLQSDVESRGASRETRTIEVGTAAEVQRLQPLVQQLYQDQWRDRAESDPADAQIVADPRGGRILVTGRPEHLQEIEQIVRKLGGGRARPESRDTRIFDLSTASAVELASTVRTLYLEQAKSRLGATTPDTTILPDSGSNRLIVVGETNELDAVEDVVRKLDKVSAQSSTARVFKLKAADPDKVAEILGSALVRYDAYGRPQKRATVSVDAKTRTLIVTGDPKELQGVSVIIDQLDTSLGAQPERRLKVVNLTRGRTRELLPRIRQVYNDQIKGQPELAMSEILLTEDPTSNQLILGGSEAQLALVERILGELQSAQVIQAPRETRMFELGQAEEVQRLHPMLQELYQDRWRNRDARDPADAQIIPDAVNARIIVTGRSNHLAEIDSILSQLRLGQNQPEARDTRVYELNASAAVELAATVRNLYRDQIRSRPNPTGRAASIMTDAVANRLIVSGTTLELDTVEQIIQKLDKVTAKTSGTRVFKLKHVSAEQVASVLSTALVTIQPSGNRVPRVSTGADPQNNLVVVAGEPRDIQSAAVIIEQMDGIAAVEQRQMQILPLKSGVASEVSARVRQIYQDQVKGRPGSGAADALILGDNVSQRLVITASDSHLRLIAEIVGKLQETGTAPARQVRVLPLQRNSAQSIAAILGQLYAKQTASQDPAERLVLSAMPDDRTLVIESAGPTFDRIDELVRTLDRAQAEGQGVIQTVHLKKARADELADAVNRTLAGRAPGAKPQRVTVTAVAGANSLLLHGSNEGVEDVLKIIRELDTESEGADIEVRIFKLENGNARELQGVLQQLLQNVTRYQARARGTERGFPASISVDERANSLIISATEAHFKVVEKVLPTLDRAPERSDRDVQFVWLRKARARDVVSTLETIFSNRTDADRPVIEADSTNNSLTIIARRGDVAQIQDLIARLDEQGKDSSIQVRLRPLDRVAAEQMARMLQNLYPQMAHGTLRVVDKVTPPPSRDGTNGVARPPSPSPTAPEASVPRGPGAAPVPEVVIAIDKAANALVLSGPAQELDHIDHIITELSFNFFGNEAEFRLFPLRDADPVLVARALTDLLRPEPAQGRPDQGQARGAAPMPRITVVPEGRTRSLIIRARPTDFPLLESLVQQLDQAGQAAQLEFRMVALAHAAPQKVLPLVQQLVTQHNAVRPGDPLTVSLDARGHGLLVIARGGVLDQVERMIQSLDTPARDGEAEVLVVPLRKSAAPQLATVLRGMLRPGTSGEWTPEALELQEQVRRLKIRDAAGAEVQLDLSRPIKISSDAGSGGNRLILTSTPSNLKALEVVVSMMDAAAVGEGVDVRIVTLRVADAAAASQTLSTIFSQGRAMAAGPAGTPSVPANETGRALVSPLNVAIDGRANALILAGHPESLELALKIVADLDRQVERFVTEVRLFRLKHASASRMLPLLQSVFAEGPAVPGTEGLSTQVTRLRTVRESQPSNTTGLPRARSALVFQADELSNILIVAARSDAVPLIQDIIEQLDIPAASGLETVRIYPLKHAGPQSIQRILNELFNGSRSASVRSDDKPVISVDERTGALVIAGNTKAFGVIEGLLQQLDQQLSFELRDLRIIPLEHTDAVATASTIQRLMDARITQRASLNKDQADQLKVIVLSDSRSNSLLVGGALESFELVESLAKQLDAAAPALSGQIRLLPLTHADARGLASTLTTLFEQRYAAAKATDLQRSKPIILADPRSNSLLVTANQEDHQSIDDLLAKLDARTDNPSLVLTVLPLAHNDAATVAPMIENIFAARLRAQTLPGQAPVPSDQIKVEPDPVLNVLVVSASPENLDLVRDLVRDLDAEPVVSGNVLESFRIEHADAQRVASLLRSLVDQGLYRPGRRAGGGGGGGGRRGGRDALAVTVDVRSNALIVSASPENLALVRELVRRLDSKEFPAAGDVRLYELKHARASSLAGTLEQYFRSRRLAESVAGQPERGAQVSVIPDDRTNVLLVSGTRDAFEAVERILQQLDAEGAFSRLNFKVFPLVHATAGKLQGTLQQIFANRTPRVKGEAVEPVTIVADPWANALLVAAGVEDMAVVESMLSRLDAEAADTGVGVHFFPLAKADARRVAQTIQGLFREGTAATGPAVSVTADERINAVVVSCGENDARRISELVRKLDTEQVARVSEIRVFPLKFARAESLSTILNTALNTRPAGLGEQSPNAQSVLQFITRTQEGRELVTAALKESVLITPDGRMNSLIVSGPVDYMGLLEQIIGHLDANSPQQAKIKVFSLQNSDSRQMADLLMQMFRMTPSTSPAGAQRSIQYTLVRSAAAVDGKPGVEEPLATATLGTAEQHALTVTIDPRTNSLLVGGTDHYVNLVSQIIDSLDNAPANERKTEVIRLKNSQANDVATAVRNFLDQEKQRVSQVLGASASDPAQRRLEREVAVVPEHISNTLLVSASPRYFEEIKAIIVELDLAQAQVLIQVLLAEVTLDSLLDLGVEWSHVGRKGDVTYGVGTDFNVKDQLTQFGGFSSAVTGTDFNFLLRALKDNGRLEVLSRPQIVTADNKPATINIGQRVPLITDSRVTERGDTINSFRYEDVGVNLSVTPKISPDGFVKMEIGTTNSTISSSSVEINKSAVVPIINQRRANTTVSVQSGQTVLIGGLIATTDDRRTKKLPVLGDIPLLGALFRSNRNLKDRKELLIMLTPQVLAQSEGTGRVRTIEEVTRESLNRSRIKDELRRDELQKQILDPLYPPGTLPPAPEGSRKSRGKSRNEL